MPVLATDDPRYIADRAAELRYQLQTLAGKFPLDRTGTETTNGSAKR
jgi:hypothetical protein